MPEQHGVSGNQQGSVDDHFRQSPPQLSLPKGGGAIRGIGEKFAANPVTGTGALSVPLFTSPGRSGFGPQLSLSYDSGAGNSPFGFGWNLARPAITRKTDKGLPQYRDSEESDVFILSGAEDLVPVLLDHEGQWQRDTSVRTVDSVTYGIQTTPSGSTPMTLSPPSQYGDLYFCQKDVAAAGITIGPTASPVKWELSMTRAGDENSQEDLVGDVFLVLGYEWE